MGNQRTKWATGTSWAKPVEPPEIVALLHQAMRPLVEERVAERVGAYIASPEFNQDIDAAFAQAVTAMKKNLAEVAIDSLHAGVVQGLTGTVTGMVQSLFRYCSSCRISVPAGTSCPSCGNMPS